MHYFILSHGITTCKIKISKHEYICLFSTFNETSNRKCNKSIKSKRIKSKYHTYNFHPRRRCGMRQIGRYSIVHDFVDLQEEYSRERKRCLKEYLNIHVTKKDNHNPNIVSNYTCLQ